MLFIGWYVRHDHDSVLFYSVVLGIQAILSITMKVRYLNDGHLHYSCTSSPTRMSNSTKLNRHIMLYIVMLYDVAR